MVARASFRRVKDTKGGGQIERSVATLLRKRLLVGIPSDTPSRQPLPGQKGTPPSNAVLGYILEHGDDERNLPPRPFLGPGVRAALPDITKGMRKAATAAFSGRIEAINDGFDEAGLAAQVSVKMVMQHGSFAPLSDRTIEARARRRYSDSGRPVGTKSSREARQFLQLRAQGTPDAVLHDAGLAQPLIDTRSLFTSIQYAIKDR